MKKLTYALLALCALNACKKDSIVSNQRQDAAAQRLEAATVIPILEHPAKPTDTDPNIRTSTLGNPTQFGYLPESAAKRKDRLFIYIPGTWATPASYHDVCRYAAYNGYYSFCVAYSNLLPVESYQGSNPNDSTVKNILDEYLTGNNVSSKVTVSRANSFENRIIKMILYMDAQFPSENWRRFLNADTTLQWNKLSVAGHSQGSDHAMYMGKARSLFRVGYMGGPGSFKLPNGQYPSFMLAPGLTPDIREYGFNHTADPVRVWSEVQNVWAALSVPGLPEDVDDMMVNGAHRLTSSLAIGDTHSGTIQDGPTPRDGNGVPLYAPLWQYMCYP